MIVRGLFTGNEPPRWPVNPLEYAPVFSAVDVPEENRLSHCRRRHWILRAFAAALLALALTRSASAAVGDPQVKTTHPYYAGELSCSTFDRLFQTEAEAYKRATGRDVSTDEDKALASWYWRNLHYAHGEEGKQDCFSAGFEKGETVREYWTGLFAHGFALCGTTHAQYTAEMNALLGHCRSRTVGVSGHNSFEVFLTGGAYGAGRWALLDHDISTVIFSPDGSRLLSIPEVIADLKRLTDPRFKPERQRGWRVSGLHDDDAKGVYDSYHSAEYLNGYTGPPPMVCLRKGESLRRYLQPGLDDGKTFVFWGMNYNIGGIPGPTRDRAWVNQPEKMHGSKDGTGAQNGRMRFANAVYTCTPDFETSDYKEAVVTEDDTSVTFEFRTPYVIGATPPNSKTWGIYDKGGRNGLVLSGDAAANVRVSVDSGQTWTMPVAMTEGLDLTDAVKGSNQYLLRFDAPAVSLKGHRLSWRTVCQCNVTTIPHLVDGPNTITYHATGRTLTDAGPTKAQAAAKVVEGQIDGKAATLELATPQGERPAHLYAASWNLSGAPPAPVKYQIEYSTDGKTWQPVVKDWQITRRPPEPNDFWSQSFTYGDLELPAGTSGPIRVRFRNDGGKAYRKVEAYVAYEVAKPSPAEVTFAWSEAGSNALKKTSHTYSNVRTSDAAWRFDAGNGVETKWVEYAAR